MAITLVVRGVEPLDRFLGGDVRDQLFHRRHTLAQKARGATDLPKNLSPGLCPTRLQVEPPPRSLWRGSLDRYMRGDPVGSARLSGYGRPYRTRHSRSEAEPRGAKDLSSCASTLTRWCDLHQECVPFHALDRYGRARRTSCLNKPT